MSSLLLVMQVSSIDQTTDELVYKHLPDKDIAKYQKLRRLQALYVQGIEQGWEEFSWKKAHDLGWTCRNDYTVFEELKDFDPEEYPRLRKQEREKRKKK